MSNAPRPITSSWLTTGLIVLVIVVISIVATWQGIKYRDRTECNSTEVENLQAQLNSLIQKNIVDSKKLKDIQSNFTLYSKFKKEANNTLNALQVSF